MARLSIINTLGEVLENYLNCDLYLVKTCFESSDRLFNFEETPSELRRRRAVNKHRQEILLDLS